MSSSSTYITTPWALGAAVDAPLAEIEKAAAERLGGADGLVIVSISGEAGGELRATITREWLDAPIPAVTGEIV